MRFNDFFDFERRIGRGYWNDYNDDGVELLYNGFYVHWDSEIISIDGAHYHFWIPKELGEKGRMTEKVEFLVKCEQAARNLGDPVLFSYAYAPEKK